MDDCLTGAQTFEEAKQIINELIYVTQKGGMNLRKWTSNDHALIDSLNKNSGDSFHCLNIGDTTKTLGVHWNPKSDS